MFNNLIRKLFSSSDVEATTQVRSLPVVEPEENTAPAPRPEHEYEDPEVTLLAEHYGPMVPGKVIVATLQQMLEWLPRSRRRKDAYDRLTKTLYNTYGVRLIINSNRDGKMEKR